MAAPLPMACAAVAVALIFWRKLSPWLCAACLLANLISGWRARRVVVNHDLQHVQAVQKLRGPRRCFGKGVVVRSPTLRDDQLAYTLEASGLDCEGRELGPMKVRLYGGPIELRRGDRIEFIAQLGPQRAFANFELSDPAISAARRGVILSGGVFSLEVVARQNHLLSLIDRARAHVRGRINETFSPAAAPLARALVLGESDLLRQDQDAFAQSGLAHLLAVSGTHLVFAILSLVKALELLLVRIEPLAQRLDVRRIAALLAIPLSLLYADFAGASGSANRAAWMLSVGLLVRASGRRPAAVRALAWSIGIGTVVDPLALYDLSFALSVLATTGLLSFGQRWSRHAARAPNRVVRYLATSAAATVSSTLLCMPCLAFLSERQTLAGVAANMVAAPFGEVVALPVCLVHGLACFWPALEQGLAVLGSGALLVVKTVAHLSARQDSMAFNVPLPNAWHVVVLCVGGFGFLQASARGFRGERHRSIGWEGLWLVSTLAGLILVERAAIAEGRGFGELVVTASDVGQGDALFVDLPDGKLMLIDGGGFPASDFDIARRVLWPVLRARRRTAIDIMVLSHPHPDHYLGLSQLIDKVKVGEFWDTGPALPAESGSEYQRMLYRLSARGVKLRRLPDLCGEVQRFAEARVRVLDPCPDLAPGASANDNSLVVRIELGRKAALFLGDAEAGQEQRLVQRFGNQLRADLLKVAHHGSPTSTTLPLVSRVQPQVSFISAGVRNRFGHPNPGVIERLRSMGSRVFCTDLMGALRFWTDGSRVNVTSFRATRWYEP